MRFIDYDYQQAGVKLSDLIKLVIIPHRCLLPWQYVIPNVYNVYSRTSVIRTPLCWKLAG